ncbi:hypothetical protein [Arthrobacter alpinus]|uniref:hypothetical protein n=1 Tax=Arthrobacter alpinus TaxID=656366 RepID=UPI000B0AE9C8|nr:hypothetical protein [Arthrobacter alpinus]
MSRIPGAGNSNRTSWSSCLAFSRWAASFLARGLVDDAGAAPPSVSPEGRCVRVLGLAALDTGCAADVGWRRDNDGPAGWLAGAEAGGRSDNDGLADAGCRRDSDGPADAAA